MWIEQGTCYRWPMDFTGLVVPATQNVYFCPLVFSAPQRIARNALPDACPVVRSRLRGPDEIICPAVDRLENDPGGYCENHIDDVEERPRWSALWLLDREVTPNVAAELSRRIAYAEGADKGGWDVTQVLRLPGTYNHKHQPPQKIEVLWAQLQLYDPREVALVYPKVEIPTNALADENWPERTSEQVEAAMAALPYGLRLMLDRSAVGADRSMELLRMAKSLIKANVPRDDALHLLERSAIARSKFDDRGDGHRVLLQTMADAAAGRLR
jgi:hypothetical protein